MPEDLQPQPENNPTPIIVAIPGVGNVHFPDDMPMEQVHVAAKNIHQKVRQLYTSDPVRPMMDTENAGGEEGYVQSKPLPDVIVGNTKGRQIYGSTAKPLADTDSDPSIPIIPLGGRAAKTSVIPGITDRDLSDTNTETWRSSFSDRGSMREGWDSNPETQKAEQEKLNSPIWRREADAQMAKTRTFLTGGDPRYTTPLSPEEEKKFQSWVKDNKIPWKDEPKADYDMRGFWKAQQSGDPNAKRSPKNLHFPDTYKTPYHESFSNESRYAQKDAPHWINDHQLADKNGKIVYDETAVNLKRALDQYDEAPSAKKGALEKQIFQKIIDYRRDAKAMDGSTKTEIDKRLAKYSNSLVKKK